MLLLKETAGALDPTSAVRIQDMIDSLKHHGFITLVNHNMQQAARCADELTCMDQSKIVELGPAQQIFVAPQRPRTQNYITGRFG